MVSPSCPVRSEVVTTATAAAHGLQNGLQHVEPQPFQQQRQQSVEHSVKQCPERSEQQLRHDV